MKCKLTHHLCTTWHGWGEQSWRDVNVRCDGQLRRLRMDFTRKGLVVMIGSDLGVGSELLFQSILHQKPVGLWGGNGAVEYMRRQCRQVDVGFGKR